VVEVASPNYYYEPLRVEINNKGKYRARKLNYVQTAQVIQMPYPLRMKAITKLRFFQAREQWRVTDFLMSPMVRRLYCMKTVGLLKEFLIMFCTFISCMVSAYC
jgi:hypothetical protein